MTLTKSIFPEYHHLKNDKNIIQFCDWANNNESKLSYIDLFCGAGGLSLGLESAGFKLDLAVDYDDSSIKTFKYNRPNLQSEKILQADINSVDWAQYDHLKGNIDLLAGGPPCQGFSTANRQRLIDDPRNYLYKKFINAVDFFKPKIVVMENVSGILNKLDDIYSDFSNVGYEGVALKYNMSNFNIPQNRSRVFILMVNMKIDLFKRNAITEYISQSLNNIQSNKYKFNLADALYDLKKLSAKTIKNDPLNQSDKTGFLSYDNSNGKTNDYLKLINNVDIPSPYIYNHISRYNNDRDIEIFSILPQGGDSTHPLIQDIMPYKRRSKIFKDKYYRLKSDNISKAITAHMKFDCNMYIHPSQARGLTPREAARIQSFPDMYVFCGSFTKWYMQIGNAVPPLFAKYLGLSIKNSIEKYA